VWRENVDVVRQIVEAWKSPDPQSALALLDEQVELDATIRPDGRVWHGRDGVRQAMTEWTGAWEDWRMEPERYVDVDDDRVLLLWVERGRGKGSGVDMEQRGATLMTLRDGRVASCVLYLDRAKAFADAGIEG
jgi:ketosteroid isomerase-like protein